MMAPTMRATATVAGVKRWALMKSCSKSPMMQAGMQVRIRSHMPLSPEKGLSALGLSRPQKRSQ